MVLQALYKVSYRYWSLQDEKIEDIIKKCNLMHDD